jgi:hypothetical protein
MNLIGGAGNGNRIKEDMGGRSEAPASSSGRPSTSGGDESQAGSKKKKQPKVG